MTTKEKEAAISDAIEKAGAFYAFGQKQFDEQWCDHGDECKKCHN